MPAACKAICKMTEIWYEGIDGIRVFLLFFVYEFETSEIFALLTKNEIRL